MATGSEAGKSAEAVLEWPKQDKKRMLHAVYRVGDLDKTIKYVSLAIVLLNGDIGNIVTRMFVLMRAI
jgi:hypothetical protein